MWYAIRDINTKLYLARTSEGADGWHEHVRAAANKAKTWTRRNAAVKALKHMTFSHEEAARLKISKLSCGPNICSTVPAGTVIPPVYELVELDDHLYEMGATPIGATVSINFETHNGVTIGLPEVN